MALSKIVKIADGMTNQYMVSFELGYIKQSDITCQVNEEVDGTGAPIYRSLVFLSPEIIQVGGAPQVSGDTVTFTRTVDRTQLIVNYEDGDVMNDENMNTAQKQAIMLIHELLDGRFERFDSGFDMGGNSITGLPVPVNPTDASNKQYVDDRLADNQQVAVDAAASAAAAASSAGQSASAAGQSAGYRDQSEAWKNKAQEWAISGTIVDSLDYSAKWWANQANTWAQAVNPGNYLLKTGGTLTGPINIIAPYPAILLTDEDAPATHTMFSIASSGGYFHLVRNTDVGGYIDSVLTVDHTSGIATFQSRPYWAGATPWDTVNLPNPVNDAPSDNSTYARKNAAWVKSVGGAIMSDTAPPSPENGQKWINTLTMREYTWYVDGTSSQWVETTNSDAQRPASDSNDYVMRNGVWVLADTQVLLDVSLSGVGANYPFILPAGFKKFHLWIKNLDFAVADYPGIQIRSSGSWVTTNTYEWSMVSTTASNGAALTAQNTSAGAQSSLAISSDNVIVGSGRYHSQIMFNTITNVFDFKTLWGRSSYNGGGYQTGALSVDGIRLVGRGGQNINTLGLKIVGER